MVDREVGVGKCMLMEARSINIKIWILWRVKMVPFVGKLLRDGYILFGRACFPVETNFIQPPYLTIEDLPRSKFIQHPTYST